MAVGASARFSRQGWFGCALPLLAANGAVTLARPDILREGWANSAVNLWGISAILWLAVAAGCDLLVRRSVCSQPVHSNGGSTRLSAIDISLLAASAIAMLLPVPAVSAVALTIISGWLIVSSPTRTPCRRAGIIFLAVTNCLMWGRLLLTFESGPMLNFEGWVVQATSGAAGQGNLIHFHGTNDVFVVSPGCSSLQGVSLAIVLWVTAVQYFDITVERRSLLTLAAMMGGAIASNVLRLDAIARWPAHFEFLHYGAGAVLFGWLALILIVAALWIGMRDALARQ